MQAARLQPSKKRKSRILTRGITLSIIFLLLSLLAWGVIKCYQPTSFPFHKVTLQGQFNYIDTTALKKTIFANIHGGFFSLKTKQLEHALLANQWIKQVSVRKVWPDRLIIILQEHVPLAWWGKTGILTQSGLLLQMAQRPAQLNLPQLDGPLGSQLDVLAQYQKLTAQLASLAVSIVQLDLSARGAWRVQLSNQTQIILGRVDVDQRWQRLVALYVKLFHNPNKQAVLVDLRYPNGLAIKWRKL